VTSVIQLAFQQYIFVYNKWTREPNEVSTSQIKCLQNISTPLEYAFLLVFSHNIVHLRIITSTLVGTCNCGVMDQKARYITGIPRTRKLGYITGIPQSMRHIARRWDVYCCSDRTRKFKDFIIPVTYGEEYKLWSSALCSFLQRKLWRHITDLCNY
jgi:hypothetical protein